jgi:hypothetical protein
MRGRRYLTAVVIAMLTWTFTSGVALGRGPAAGAEFMFQDEPPAPFERSTTYVVVGERTKEGCAFTYPEFRMPPDVDRWQVRDLGIDPERCLKLVEEGLPTENDPIEGPQASVSMDAPIEAADVTSGASASVAGVASGYSRAWTEDAAGWDVSVDTTYISWTYSSPCVTSGSASAGWSWIYGTGWRLVGGSNGVTANRTCSRLFADSWSTMTNSDFFLCPWATFYTYYYHVRAYGWPNGSMTGSRSTQIVADGLCLPLWAHFEAKKTG